MRRIFAILTILMVCLSGGTSQDTKKEAPKKPKAEATPAEAIQTLPDFKVELLLTSDAASQGSWINLAKDKLGLIISGQRGQALQRVTLKDGKVDTITKLNLPITEAMGLLYAFDSLYINGSGPKGFGLYRCTDTKGSGQYDEVKFLKGFEGAGEHGPHGIAMGPDKKLYIMNGNHTKLPEGLSKESPYRNYQEDLLLPRQWDGNGHAAGILSPGGYVVRTDADGKEWELVLGGFRNAYDIAFNAEGELFTFDSDMEWDWGMPWYRPTRINHCVSGAEFGWRSGTGVWPEFYLDSLGSTVDIGIGSPTGVTNGVGAKFPAKYQKAMFVLDWSYGRLMAVHLTPKGSGYTATFENFVSPKGLSDNGPRKPLNLTDAIIGDDGAMYFTIGGRNTQAGLYRVTYTGSESTAAAKEATGAAERKARHDLEVFHGKVDPKAVEAAWPALNSDDRNLRFAARVAIESQPVAEWKAKALSEKYPNAAFAGLVALVRNAPRETQPEILTALEKFPMSSLSPSQKLDKLRLLGVSFIRQGTPAANATKKLLAELNPMFPTKDSTLDRELSQVLIYLQAPGIAAKCLKEMAAATTQEDMIHYLFHLRTLPIGQWTLDERKEYFSYYGKDRRKAGHPNEMTTWFKQAGRPYADGNSYNNFLKNFFKEATANLSDAERKALAPQLEAIDKASVVSYEVKARPVVKQWKTDDILPLLSKVENSRSFDKGKEAYLVGQCIKCHRFGQEGGAVGPELTAIATRYDRRAILESITEPSKVLSDQYQNMVITTLSGKKVVGRVVDSTKEKIVVQLDPLSPERVEIKRDDIETEVASKVSPMPEHLIDSLTQDEILDLIAYLESAGNKGYRSFRR